MVLHLYCSSCSCPASSVHAHLNSGLSSGAHRLRPPGAGRSRHRLRKPPQVFASRNPPPPGKLERSNPARRHAFRPNGTRTRVTGSSLHGVHRAGLNSFDYYACSERQPHLAGHIARTVFWRMLTARQFQPGDNARAVHTGILGRGFYWVDEQWRSSSTAGAPLGAPLFISRRPRDRMGLGAHPRPHARYQLQRHVY